MISVILVYALSCFDFTKVFLNAKELRLFRDRRDAVGLGVLDFTGLSGLCDFRSS